MSAAFASLLERAGFDTSEPEFWQRVVLVHNWGMVPAARLDHSDATVSRGFNALVLDRRGVPTHFCKCRPPTREWIRQTNLSERISMVPALRQMVPRAWSVSSPHLHLSIAAYVPGRLLASSVPWMRASALGATMREILEGMEVISRHAAMLESDVTRSQTPVDLRAEAAWAFGTVPASLLAPRQASVIRDAIAAAGTVPRVLQHGDLWPMNILRYDGHWWLVDFEIFGRIQVPLYDVFHLARSCWALRQGRWPHAIRRARRALSLPDAQESWIGCLRSSGGVHPYPGTLAWAQSRYGLTRSQAVGTLAYYLIDVIARMYRRRVAMYLEPYVTELGVLADCLESGERFEEAFGDRAA